MRPNVTQIDINGSDASTVHLFRLDLPPEAVERFTAMAGTGEWPLKYGLGATKLRPGFVETVDLRDLGPMPLSQYLSEAHDLPTKALGADRARIDALTGHVVILPPQAFDSTSQTLNVNTPLSHVGSWSAAPAKARSASLRSTSAEGSLSGGGESSMTGLSRAILITALALAALVVLVLVLVL